MSAPRCQYCGQSVVWVKREDGSIHPPLISLGVTYVVRAGVVHDEVAYARHFCRDDDVLVWEKAKVLRRQAEEVEGVERRERVKEQRALINELNDARDLAWVEAIDRACPKCGAEPGEQCENLAKRAKGIAAYTSWPHTERRIERTLEATDD